jgi:hypothetical protein
VELHRVELNLTGVTLPPITSETPYILNRLEQVDLMTIQEGLELLRRKYQHSIDGHSYHCARNMCRQYKDPKEGLTCSEDLMFLHEQMTKIHHMLFLIQGEGL